MRSRIEVSHSGECRRADRAAVERRFVETVRAEAGSKTWVVQRGWETHSPKTGAPRGYLDLNVDMGDGPGSVQLEIGRFPGTPEAAAEADRAAYGNCAPPSRTTLPDGTVLQLYQADYESPAIPMQHLAVYQPNGRHYIVTTAGYGGAYTVTSGRGRLPLDDSGIAEVAAAIAELGT